MGRLPRVHRFPHSHFASRKIKRHLCCFPVLVSIAPFVPPVFIGLFARPVLFGVCVLCVSLFPGSSPPPPCRRPPSVPVSPLRGPPQRRSHSAALSNKKHPDCPVQGSGPGRGPSSGVGLGPGPGRARARDRARARARAEPRALLGTMTLQVWSMFLGCSFFDPNPATQTTVDETPPREGACSPDPFPNYRGGSSGAWPLCRGAKTKLKISGLPCRPENLVRGASRERGWGKRRRESSHPPLPPTPLPRHKKKQFFVLRCPLG
jgi:hypothetical protein